MIKLKDIEKESYKSEISWYAKNGKIQNKKEKRFKGNEDIELNKKNITFRLLTTLSP